MKTMLRWLTNEFDKVQGCCYQTMPAQVVSPDLAGSDMEMRTKDIVRLAMGVNSEEGE